MSENVLEHFIHVTPTQAKEYVRWCIKRKRTFWLHGSPGTAKSFVLNALAKSMDLLFKDDRLSQMDSVDLRGLLDLDREAGVSRWLPPATFPTDNDPPGLWFLDEFPDASDEVKKASYQLVHDRAIGEYKVPDHWAIGAAGNLITDMSNVNRTPAALNNRFCHLYVRPEIEDWTITAAIPQNFHPMVVGFLRWKPSWLHAYHGMPRNELIQLIRTSDAFHTCRTWEYVSDVVHDYGTDKKAIDKAFPLIAGFVGLSAATEFKGYVQYYSQLPDIDELIANPGVYQVPQETAVQWALCSAVSLKITADNLKNVMRFAKKLPDEMQAGMIIAAYRRDMSIADSEAFADWSVKQSVNLF
jgi:hypothetical protein